MMRECTVDMNHESCFMFAKKAFKDVNAGEAMSVARTEERSSQC